MVNGDGHSCGGPAQPVSHDLGRSLVFSFWVQWNFGVITSLWLFSHFRISVKWPFLNVIPLWHYQYKTLHIVMSIIVAVNRAFVLLQVGS